MLQKMRVLLLVCITAVLAACGGGGGGDDAPNFAGSYSTSATLISNNCNAGVPGSILGVTSIGQSGRTVTLVGNDLALSGSVDADNGGFTVTNSQVSSGVTVLTVFNFRTITSGSKYSVQVSITAAPCSAVYTGIATKI